MVGQSDRKRDSWICLRRTDEPIGELRIPTGDDRVELRGVRVRKRARRLELRSMVLVEEVGRDAIPDGSRKRGPLPGDLQLLGGSTIGERAYLGESGQKSGRPECRWRRKTQLAL